MKKLPLNSFSGHSGHVRPGTEHFATDFALTGKREEGKTGKWRKREEGFMTFRFVPHPSFHKSFLWIFLLLSYQYVVAPQTNFVRIFAVKYRNKLNK